MSDIFEFTVKAADGKPHPLSAYRGKVLLIVNVASKCGFTPQYEGLQKLYEIYRERGLEILGFPCNQFMSQEPGSAEDIQKFCTLTYGVSFPVLAKVDVNGEHADPLFAWLKSSAPGFLGSEFIKWNFTKFLLNREGQVVQRFAPKDEPGALKPAIEKLLG